MIELPVAEKGLKSLELELQDGAYDLIEDVIITTDARVGFKDADFALLIGSKPRGPGESRADVLKPNAKIFITQGKILDEVAKKSVKVVVVGNPCNTNALIAMKAAPSIPKQNFTALTRLDQNRAVKQI